MSDDLKITGRLQKVLDRAVETSQTAGMNILVLKDGEEVAYAQAGYADLENKKPFTRDTIMRMFSMSKPVTAAAVMLLVQRGLISLGEPVSRYLPGFENQQIIDDDGNRHTVTRPAYIRDLLSMTSGLPYGNKEGIPAEKSVAEVFDRIDAKLYTDEAMGTVEIANELGRAGTAFQPGDHWQYGTSADILGAIVETVTGKRYGDFLREEIFEPLEMKDTAFYVPEEKRSRLAEAYTVKKGQLSLYKTDNLGIRYYMEEDPAFQSGGAGLASTIDDYSHFATMLMNGGTYKGQTILDDAIVKYMTHGRLTPWQQERMWRGWDSHAGYSYGCLMQHMIKPDMSYFLTYMDEYGWDGWLGTYFCNSPENRLTILLGMQVFNEDGNYIFEKVRNTLGQIF